MTWLTKREYATYMRLEEHLADKNWKASGDHQPDYRRAGDEAYKILGYSPRRGRF